MMDASTDAVDVQEIVRALTAPQRVFSRSEVLAQPCPVPKERGVYAWFFKEVPQGVPVSDCLQHGELTLLYVGISPHEAFKPTTKQNLRRRIQGHYRGNASGSTLRKTLGVLLERTSGFPLRRTGKTERLTLTPAGEEWLSQWMAENAFVVWLAHPEPWIVEQQMLKLASCPLNLADNEHHSRSLRAESRVLRFAVPRHLKRAATPLTPKVQPTIKPLYHTALHLHSFFPI
jgi:hypothetical protein